MVPNSVIYTFLIVPLDIPHRWEPLKTDEGANMIFKVNITEIPKYVLTNDYRT